MTASFFPYTTLFRSHRECGLMLTGLAEFIADLHPQQRLRLHPESMLEADRHIGRQGGPPVEDGADRRAADAEGLCQLVDRNPVGLDDFGLEPLPGMDCERRMNLDSHQ